MTSNLLGVRICFFYDKRGAKDQKAISHFQEKVHTLVISFTDSADKKFEEKGIFWTKVDLSFEVEILLLIIWSWPLKFELRCLK